MEEEIKTPENIIQKHKHYILLLPLILIILLVSIFIYYLNYTMITQSSSPLPVISSLSTSNANYTLSMLTLSNISILGKGRYYISNMTYAPATIPLILNIKNNYDIVLPLKNILNSRTVDYFGNNSITETVITYNGSASSIYLNATANIKKIPYYILVQEQNSSNSYFIIKYNTTILSKYKDFPTILFGYTKNNIVFAVISTNFGYNSSEYSSIIPQIVSDIKNNLAN